MKHFSIRRYTGVMPHDRVRRWLAYNAPTEPYDLFALNLVDAKQHDLILDNGTGNGRFAAKLAARGCNVVALDLNLTLIKAARQNTIDKPVHTVLADMTYLPFSNKCFDRIISVHNLWYVPDYTKAIHEMQRVLRSGGVMVVDHLNLLDLKTYTRLTFYAIAILALAKKRVADIGRMPIAIMRPFLGTKFLVWSVMTYQPLKVVQGVRCFARRFLITCTV